MTLYLQTKNSLSVSRKLLCFALMACVAALFPLRGQGNADAVFVPISKYLYEGDADKLSAWFFDSIELSFSKDESAVMSRRQACLMMQSFFENHQPESFNIYHSASKANVKCVVGKLAAGGENFNVSIFASNRGDGYKIQKMQIVKE